MNGSTTEKMQSLPEIFVLATMLTILVISPAMGASVYLVPDHSTAQIDAYNINADGTVTYQISSTLQYSSAPSGIAVDAITTDGNPVLFITSETSGGVEVLDPVSMTCLGVSSGPLNLAGIDVDDADDIVFALARETNDLYVFQWNSSGPTLNQLAMVELPGMWYGSGLAFDDSRDILWVADTGNSLIRAYNTAVTDWGEIVEIPDLSFGVTQRPVEIAVDTDRSIAYTVAGWIGDTRLCKYDMVSGMETLISLGAHGGIGVAVDEATGYVYVTRGPSGGDDLQVWDLSSALPGMIQFTGDLGNPAGLAVDPGQSVSPDIPVGFDIHPRTCPTPFNPIRRGIIPAAILGSADFDVAGIDAASVLIEGLVPAEIWIEDISRPGGDEECSCSKEGPDGYPDLAMKFNAEDLSAAIQASGGLSAGDEIWPVTVTGMLSGGMPINGTDCLFIKGSTDEFDFESPEPNPFNPMTKVAFTLRKTSAVKLNVMDVRGRVVATLIDEIVPAGWHEVQWKAERAASGVYFVCLTVEGKTKVQRAVLLK